MVGRTIEVFARGNLEGYHGHGEGMSRLSIHALLAPTTEQNLEQTKCEYHGRKYYEKWFGTYPFPSDEGEQERLDALHETFYNVALESSLHIASLRPGRIRVLDVGYGSGIWAISMAQKYPQAEVIAIDIGNDHPHNPGVNFGVKFISGVDFTTDNWGLASEEPFDFIHMGQLCGSVPDWRLMFGRAHRLLKYGGQIESVEFDWTPQTEPENQLPPNSPVNQWWYYMHQATNASGKPLAYPTEMEKTFYDAGFNVMNHRVVKIHACEDMNLPPDDVQNRLARWYRYTMFTPIFGTIRGLSLALFTHKLQFRPEVTGALCAEVNAALNSTNSPVFHKLHVVTARKK